MEVARSLGDAPPTAAATLDPVLSRILEELWNAAFASEASFQRWFRIYGAYLADKVVTEYASHRHGREGERRAHAKHGPRIQSFM